MMTGVLCRRDRKSETMLDAPARDSYNPERIPPNAIRMEETSMQSMTSEWRDRLGHWLTTLGKDLYLPLGDIPVETFCTMDHLTVEEARVRPMKPMREGTAWGHEYEYCWMHGTVVLPQEAKGRRIVMDLNCGGESTLYVNGRSFGTYRAPWVQFPHHYIEDNWLTESGEPGVSYDILIEAYAGHFYPETRRGNGVTGPVIPGDYEDELAGKKRRHLGHLTYGIWNEDAYQLLMDMETLDQLGDQVDQDGLRAEKIADALQRATLVCDFEQDLEGRIRSYRAAREVLRPVLEAHNGSTAPVFYAIGNAHIDLAWLWPMAETHRKTSRTFAAQLRHLGEYKDYKYLQSQPAAYVMCREHDPDLYARIQAAVKEGRWIPEGAMWVEPDTNMTSGESLIRQILYGKRFFREEFGVESEILWLPDSFGYSAALPQILKKTGVKYLVTQKIFWSYNDSEKFPYHYFTWQGADGSCIDTFLPTSYTYRTDPKEICETWRKRSQRRDLDAFLLPFGYGDGGGGPARDHLEYLAREKDLEGMPRVRMEDPRVFFREMEAAGGPKHTYAGELYFCAHRGVYTSQAAVKKGNRRSELALRDAEMWGAMAQLCGTEEYAYPAGRMEAAWKKLLLNQFHDILPGSSIARVYEEAARDHSWIQSEAEAVRDAAMQDLLSTEGRAGKAMTVFNSVSFPRSGLVRLPERFRNGARTLEGEAVPVQACADGVYALVTVPSCGAVSLLPSKRQAEVEAVRVTEENDGIVMENGEIRVCVNARGEVTSFVDLWTGREFAAGPMNHLLAYKDVPRRFDAWDIDSNYILQELPLDEPVEVSITEQGGLRGVVHVRRRVLNSVFEQDLVLESGKHRLDFVTHVDWHELHRLLKVEFPVDVEATEGINEIQFGYMARPTHRSRPYDQDRYEVCNQRYSALCDHSHGAAVLNDCKYGISMNGHALQLTLLRAPASPAMRGDNGEHTFTYAFTGWDGDFLDSPVVEEAYDLNVPLRTMQGATEAFSLFDVSVDHVMIDTVKPAEDGSGDLILRLYEAKKADTTCRLTPMIPWVRAEETDMLENTVCTLEGTESVELHFKPFEVKTLRLSWRE